jgi:hypothetical protein
MRIVLPPSCECPGLNGALPVAHTVGFGLHSVSWLKREGEYWFLHSICYSPCKCWCSMLSILTEIWLSNILWHVG